MTCCCFEIIIAAISNRLIGIVIVLCEHFLKCTKFKKVKKFTIAVFIKTKMGAINFFKKVTNAAYLQILLFGNMRGTLQVALERVLKKKKQEKVTIEEFNYYFQNLWNIRRWLDASDSEVKILNEDDEIYIVRD